VDQVEVKDFEAVFALGESADGVISAPSHPKVSRTYQSETSAELLARVSPLPRTAEEAARRPTPPLAAEVTGSNPKHSPPRSKAAMNAAIAGHNKKPTVFTMGLVFDLIE
jgi:hypothetical protein